MKHLLFGGQPTNEQTESSALDLSGNLLKKESNEVVRQPEPFVKNLDDSDVTNKPEVQPELEANTETPVIETLSNSEPTEAGKESENSLQEEKPDTIEQQQQEEEVQPSKEAIEESPDLAKVSEPENIPKEANPANIEQPESEPESGQDVVEDEPTSIVEEQPDGIVGIDVEDKKTIVPSVEKPKDPELDKIIEAFAGKIVK